MDKMTAEQALWAITELVCAASRDEARVPANFISNAENALGWIEAALSAPKVPAGWKMYADDNGVICVENQATGESILVPTYSDKGDLWMRVAGQFFRALLAASPEPVSASDKRPANCRERLREEGKAYPRTGCLGCGSSLSNGGLKTCPYAEGNNEPVAPKGRNEYGLDVSYFHGKLSQIVRDCQRYTPDEMARSLARLAVVADDSVLAEKEFVQHTQQVIADLRADVIRQKSEIDDLHKTIHTGSGKSKAIASLIEEREDLRAEVEALREVIGELISAATLGANWMRFWIDHSECDCEDGHHCGVNKRMEEVEKIEKAIKKAGAARQREGGE